jgi:nucleoside-diphosphate-sugar epimerase
MRVFLAGASGVIGVRLVPLLVETGHTVAGMTRSHDRVKLLEGLGAQPVVCDVFDRGELEAVVGEFKPDLVMHQLTDLPDEVRKLPEFRDRNDRIRSEGTRNLLAAAEGSAVRRFIAQSIAWSPAGSADIVADHERMVLEAGGVVIRYGVFYGPGTYSEDSIPPPPRIQIDEAARRTMPLLAAETGVFEIVED